MRIAMISKYLPYLSGPSVDVFFRARLLSKMGHEVHVFTYPSYPDGVMDLKRCTLLSQNGANIKIYYIPLQSKWKLVTPPLDLLFTNAIISAANTINFDVIEGHFAVPHGFSAVIAGQALNVPSMITFYGSDARIFALDPNYKEAVLWMVKNASVVIAVSQELKDLLINLGDYSSKINVIPLAVDIEFFNKVSMDDVRALRQSLGWERAFIVAYIGRLVKEKGLEYLVRAIPLVIKKIPQARFLIVGNGNYQNDLEVLVCDLEASKYIQVVPGVDDIRVYMHACDIFVLPSLADASPRVVKEAMVCQKAIVATRVGGIPYEIENSKEGLLVLERNPEAIAEAIIYLANNPELRLKLGQNGYQRALRDFNLKTRMEQIVNIYQNLA